MHKSTLDSDALLLSMQRSKQPHYRELVNSALSAQDNEQFRSHDGGLLEPGTRVPVSPYRQRERDVLDTLDDNPHLANELHKQCGGQAKQMALKAYAKDESQRDSKQPKLIEEIIANRNREFYERKENNAMHVRSLNEERQRLMKEKDALKEKRRLLRKIPDSDEGRRKRLVSFLSGQDSEHSVHDVTSYYDIPRQVERINKLKEINKHRVNKLVRPYQGELGPKSYQMWQMPHYNMARSIVEDVVENFLDVFFKSSRPAASREQALALSYSEKMNRDRQREALRKATQIQLIMEELILEETEQYARSIAREYKNLHQYVKNRADMHFMRQGEAVATGVETGRDDNDPLYHLITKGYFGFQKERFNKRKDLWIHRQHTHVKDEEPKPRDEIKLPSKSTSSFWRAEEEDADVEMLYFGDIIPMEMREYTMKPKDSYPERVRMRDFGRYMVSAKLYWQKIWCEVKEEELSAKCQGVTAAAVSWNNRLIALGTAHGDLLIYDLAARPYRVLRALANSARYLDPIDSIAWSLDGTKLVTTNTLGGTLKAWSWHNTNVHVERSDLSSIGVKPDSADYMPGPLRNVLDLDVDRFETKFQSGAFAEMDLQKGVYGPTMAAFFPALSFFANQNHVCIALDNGDILKCDVEENYNEHTVQVDTSQGGPPVTISKDTPKMYKPTIPTEVGISRIGQGVPAELLRQHKYPIIFMGFVENNRNMITVDQKGFINVWRYSPKCLNSYNYFTAHKQYRIDFHKTMFTPLASAKPVIVFTDRRKYGDTTTSQVRMELQREKAEEQISNIGLPDPWHKTPPSRDGLISTVYAPKEQVSDSGAIFHIITRHQDTGKLSTYATRVYKPVKIKSPRMLGCRMTPDGKELVFVFLFPEYPPKLPHLTIVRVNVCDMVMVDWRRDIVLDGELYQRILENNLVNFDVSQVHGPTGSAYIFLNISGELHGYSLTTGLKVLRSFDPKEPDKQFKGAIVGDSHFGIADSAQISVANYAGRFYLVIYSSSKKESERQAKAGRNKKYHNKVVFIELMDFNKDPVRLNVWQLYSNRSDHVPLPPNTHVVNMTYSRTATNHHRTAYVSQILMDLIDDVIERKTRKYSEEELKDFEELDRNRNYEQLRPEVVGRRTPISEDYEPADIQRGISPV